MAQIIKDRRKGVKPTTELARKVTKAFTLYSTRNLSAATFVDYSTLRKVSKREPVKQHIIDQLNNVLPLLLK